MSDRPRFFVELCCGSAAVTLKLLGGKYAKPPISYMGSKAGYAHAILAAMGLRMGQGADHVLLAEAGPWAQVWSVLADPARCAEVARILRSWSDEDPRELWERLRDEHRGEWDGWTAERAAGWAFQHGASWKGEGTHYAERGTGTEGGETPITPIGIARRVESVAAWLSFSAFTWNNLPVWVEDGEVVMGEDVKKARRRNRTPSPKPFSGPTGIQSTSPIADRCDRGYPGLSVYAGPAEDIEPPDDCDGVYVYIDPPYQGTTGYSADMPRETVLEVARRWSDAGAVVCVSEAVPLPLDGWHHVDITDARKGQKRTFSKQRTEWLTLNREPAEVPVRQQVMFG